MKQVIRSHPSVLYALFSHGFQKYDVFLYGFFIPIISPLFFPTDRTIATLAAFGTFAAGYLVRPIGALYFGHLGDKFGRKKAFMLSVLLVIVPTIAVACLPNYQQIGIWAPITLIFCRLIQGFAAGGEFSGAVIYVSEHLSKKQQGLAGSIVRSVGFFGVALGTGIGYLTTLPNMPEYAWRFPFIFGAVISLLSYFLREKMLETPDFIQESKNRKLEVQKVNTHPSETNTSYALKVLFQDHKWNFMCSIFISSCSYIFLYFTTIYLGSIYKHEGLISTSEAMLVNTTILFMWGVLTPIAGILADKVGLKKFLSFISFGSAVIMLPLFMIFYNEATFINLFTFQIILTFLGAAYFGPAPGLFKELFPTGNRFSGVSLSNTLAQAFIGSTTPAIATAMVAYLHSNLSPAFLLILGCFAALFAINKMYDAKQTMPIRNAFGTA